MNQRVKSEIRQNLSTLRIQTELTRAAPAQPKRPKSAFHASRALCMTSIKRLAEQGLSMSGTGNCHDNAPIESCLHSLNVEETHGQDFASRAEARHCVFG
jgi:transposase InsO family protein